MRLIGDEIHYEGHLVAIVTDEITPTVRDRFEDQIRKSEDALTPDAYEELREKCGKRARGGLLKLTDLDAVIKEVANK